MFESFFHLARRPFVATPDIATYYPAAVTDEARRSIERTIECGAGSGLLIGPPGTGKSLVCALLAERFGAELEVAWLAGAQLATRRALLQAILFEMNQPYRGMDEGELRLHLIDHLTRRDEAGPGLLLIVDEAQTLSLRLLEELRLITNIVRQGEPRVRLVMSGGPVLEERFAAPQMESFSQRIAARAYLQPFSHADTLGYVTHQIRACGGDVGKIFSPDALDSIHRASDGIPRLINQICDHALLLAAAAEKRPIDARTIEEAWADLQQLPTPWRDAAPERAAASQVDTGSVIEFGGLDDEVEPISQQTVSAPLAEHDDFHASVERLDQLERQVGDMVDEFRPAGSIRPEVEFVLPAFVPSAGHAFDEEEILLDRYAALDAGCWAGRPQVASREGRELGRMLERIAQAGRESGARRRAPASTGSERRWTEAPAETVVALPLSHASPTEPGELIDPDSDLIVVEDELTAPAATVARRIAPVRRQEYRQLFARLRRG